MPSLHAFSLGPIPDRSGTGLVYLASLDGKLLHARATTPGEALAELRAQAPAQTRLFCTRELMMVGLQHGFVSAEPDEALLALRAQLAVWLAHDKVAPRADDALLLLISAAADFFKARVWERAPAEGALQLTITGALQRRYEVAVMGAAGQQFGVALYPKPGTVERITRAMKEGRRGDLVGIEGLSLTLDPEPAFAARAVQAWCGLPRTPRVLALRGGDIAAASREELQILALTLSTLGQLQGSPGEQQEGTLLNDSIHLSARLQCPEAP